MNIVSWNCQGLGSILTFQHLRAIVAHDRPSIVSLMEIKNKREVVDMVRNQLQFQQSIIFDPMGLSGGLVVMWNEDVLVGVEDSSDELINITCRDPNNGIIMRITFLRASTIYPKRLRLWQKLRSIH